MTPDALAQMEIAVLNLYIFEYSFERIFDRYFEINGGSFGKFNVEAAQKAKIRSFFLVWKQCIHNRNQNSID